MQALTANKQTIYYALYTGKTAVVVDGKKTGEWTEAYATPVAMKANVSAARGNAETEQFGITDNYDRTICVSDTACPIQEDTILWIGTTPDNNTPHTDKVVRVAKSLNSVLIAVRKVSVA